MNLLDMAQQCWHVTYKQPQVKTERNGFHFFNVLYKNTYRSSNAAWLFLTRPYPHLQTEIEEYEERRKTGGC